MPTHAAGGAVAPGEFALPLPSCAPRIPSPGRAPRGGPSWVRSVGGAVRSAGPSVGIRVRAKATAALEGESGSGNVGKDLARHDLGVVAGAGVDTGRFIVEVRYTWGLSNINRNPSEDDTTIKTRVLAAMAGVRF